MYWVVISFFHDLFLYGNRGDYPGTRRRESYIVTISNIYMELKSCKNCNKKIEPREFCYYPSIKYCSQECNEEYRAAQKTLYDTHRGDKCEVCGNDHSVGLEDNRYSRGLAVHHKNEDAGDNRIENLMTVCFNCHSNLHRRV